MLNILKHWDTETEPGKGCKANKKAFVGWRCDIFKDKFNIAPGECYLNNFTGPSIEKIFLLGKDIPFSVFYRPRNILDFHTFPKFWDSIFWLLGH